MSYRGTTQVYRSVSRLGLPRYRWRVIFDGAVRSRSDHAYATRWTAKRGARRAFPDLPIEVL